MVRTKHRFGLVAYSFYWMAQVMMVRGAEAPYVERILLRGARNALLLAGSIRPNAERQCTRWALYVPFGRITLLSFFPGALKPSGLARDEIDRCAKQLRMSEIPIVADLESAWNQFSRVRESYAPATFRLQRLQSSAMAA